MNTEIKFLQETEAANEAGKFALIQLQTANLRFSFPKIESLQNDLQLIYGIGSVTAAKLNQAGIYTDIGSLAAFPVAKSRAGSN